MPMYNFQCECGAAFEFCVPVEHRDHVVCNHCGNFAQRVWTVAPHMHADSIPGGMWIENLGPQPMRFDSKSDYRDAVKARGLMPMVRHTPPPDSDKSKHTSRWI